MNELNAIATIAYRDILKFIRDRPRLIGTFIFPLVVIAALGGSLQSNLGKSLGYDFLTFTFTGVFAQSLFQSAAFGVISLIEDRQNDFSQEIFISPISRYSIIIGKIMGETCVALVQGIGITFFALLLGVSMTPVGVVGLLGAGFVSCLLGGTFGIFCLANVESQRAANQLFPFLFLPQFFLAGVFNPIKKLPLYLDVLSHVSPLRYAVDLTRGLFYAGTPAYDRVVIATPLLNLAISTGLFVVFLVVGTTIFVRRERNR